MSDFRRGEFWHREKKRPAPAHGIKIARAGATWWGARWIEALEKLGASYGSRLARGKTYARTGRTHDFVVGPGGATAHVTGSRDTPYVVRIALAELDDATWTRALEAMSAEARFAAELLAGEMPRAIDDAFRAAGTSLFPTNEAELQTSCSCPDWANPCKHVAATHYVLGDALDRDPFLLFELRGRTRSAVLEALRRLRSDGRRARARDDARDAAPPTTSFRAVKPEAYDAWRGSPPDIAFSMTPPATNGALLRQLGKPASWRATTTPVDLLGPLVHAASQRARRIALGELHGGSDHDDDAGG
jgi:uncharacterized Zn finger protein